MINFCVLSSGSKGNCTYVQSGSQQVLIDCGLSAKQLEVRLAAIEVEPSSIDAIVISHEHSDHIRGLPVFVKRHKIPVHLNHSTFEACSNFLQMPKTLISFFETGATFSIGDLFFESFSVQHDAADPVGFTICSAAGTALSVVTDLGRVTHLVREQVKRAHALILESNHCPALLEEAPYPWTVKQRISSGTGHLSNQTAGDLLTELSNSSESRLEIVVAAHISENSNCPERALSVLKDAWKRGENGNKELEFVAASAKEATKIFRIFNGM